MTREYHPTDPVEDRLTAAQINAIKAVWAGEATPEQQKHALGAIINVVASTHELDWIPDCERSSSFASGKRFVGLQILKILNVSTDKLTKRQRQ